MSIFYFMNQIFKNKKSLAGIILFLSFFAFGSIAFSQNSTTSKIYFKGPTGDLAPGSEFTVGVLLDTMDPINAFDLEISYPKDKLEFLSFDNTASIVNIWQPAPVLLPNGNLGLTGGIIKAWSDKAGLLIKISFRALNSGSPKLSFAKNNLYIPGGAKGGGKKKKKTARPLPSFLSHSSRSPL